MLQFLIERAEILLNHLFILIYLMPMFYLFSSFHSGKKILQNDSLQLYIHYDFPVF